MMGLGATLIVAGVIWACAALSMDTTVALEAQEMHNLGLMAERGNHLMLSGLTVLSGVIFVAAGYLKEPPSEKTDTLRASATRECPYCAETIRATAIKCGYCGSEIEPSNDVPEIPGESPVAEEDSSSSGCELDLAGQGGSSSESEPEIAADEDGEFYTDALRVFNTSEYGVPVVCYMIQANSGPANASVGRGSDYPDQALVTVAIPDDPWAMQWLFNPYSDSEYVQSQEVDLHTLPPSVKNWNATLLDDGTLVVAE